MDRTVGGASFRSEFDNGGHVLVLARKEGLQSIPYTS